MLGKTASMGEQRAMDEREDTRYFGSVRFFKNLILLVVLVLIAVPCGLAVHFFRGLERTKELLREAQEASELAWVEDEDGEFTASRIAIHRPFPGFLRAAGVGRRYRGRRSRLSDR